MDAIRAFYDHAYGLMKAGDLDEAERTLRRAVVIYERNANIVCLLGEVLLRQRQPQQARQWYERCLDWFPGYPRALEGAGKAYLADGKAAKAVPLLQAAAEAVPRRAPTQLALSRALAMADRKPESEAARARALALDPDRAVALEAAAAIEEERLDEAEQLLRQHLADHPEDPVALRLLAQVATNMDRRLPAIRLLTRAVEAAPDFMPAWQDLASAYMKEDNFELALTAVDEAIRHAPRLVTSLVIKGGILTKAHRYEEALAVYEEALALQPGHGGALSGKGHALKTIGRTDEAIAALKECVRAHPSFGEPWWALANLKTYSFDEEELALLEQLVDNDVLPDETRVNMNYALGKHRENQASYGPALAAYQAGAGLRRAQESYDPVMNQMVTDRTIEVFDAEFFAARQGWGAPDSAPILVVGLPRSGSTLIEQILASHSAIEGTQELTDLTRRIRDVSQAQQDGREYPEAVRELSAADARMLGERYLEGTQRYRSGKPHFIDKMPNNFAHVGFLHLLLPGARVINACRHPLDSCIGTYKQLFYGGQSFSYDFFELGQYYMDYQRLMDHWHAVLPSKVLDVRYEDVVTDLEGQVHRMLDFLELPFEDSCLRFWETDRAINTASSEQVRQPLYTKGLDFWRHYETELDELIDQLEPLLRQLPAERQPLRMQEQGER